jgi:hypothetical protein
MSTTNLSAKHITAILLSAAMCFAFFTINISEAYSEEIKEDNTASQTIELEKRTAMMEQIKALRETIANHKAGLKAEKKEYQEEKKEEYKEVYEEKREELKLDRAAFMLSLDGLNEEEKRAAMMEFISEIKASLETQKESMKAQMDEKKEDLKVKKEEVKEKREEKKAIRLENREEFQASLEGLSAQEKVTAILARLTVIKAQIENGEADTDGEGNSKVVEETNIEESSDEEADETEDDEDDEDVETQV